MHPAIALFILNFVFYYIVASVPKENVTSNPTRDRAETSLVLSIVSTAVWYGILCASGMV